MSALTKEQIATLPGMVARLGGHDGFGAWDASDSLRDMAPSLAATVIEQQAEIERLRGLLWYAWNEFNAIRARSGAPLDHYQMTTVSPEWWETMLESFGEAIGDENQKPWPSPAARAALEVKP